MKIGLTTSHADVDPPLAEHFGKAKWLVVMDAPDRLELVRNEGLDGRSVAAELAARGCTDVIVGRLGPGAYAHVRAAGMRVWRGLPGASARALAEALRNGRLEPLLPADVVQLHGHGGARGARH